MRRRLAAGLAAAALVALGLVVAGGTAGATEFQVTNTDPSAATVGSLPWAFAQASASSSDSIITVAPALAGQTVDLTDELLYAPLGATASLTVNGNGLIVHQTGVGKRVVHTQTTGLLSMDSVTLTGGNTVAGDPRGAAIYDQIAGVGVAVALSNCTVENNTSTDSAANDASIIWSYDTTITNCTITNNRATGTAAASAAIFFTINTTVTNSTIANNTNSTLDGTALGIFFTDNTTVTNSTIANNTNKSTATGNALGIIVTVTMTTISDSTIDGNTNSAVDGDARSIIFTGTIATISGSTIDGNTNSAVNGDAIGIFYTSNIAVTNATITNNTNSTVIGKTFGILFAGDITMTSSTVTNNTNKSTVGGTAYGIFNGTMTTISGSTIDGNTNSTVDGYTAGIFNTSNFSLTDATITNNTNHTDSGGSFGIVVSSGSTNSVTTSTIANNLSTTGDGDAAGAIYVPGSAHLTVTNSTISGNVASGTTSHGGAIDKQSVAPVSLSEDVPGPDDKGPLSPVEEHGDAGVSAVDPFVTLVYSTIVDNTAAVGANLDLPDVRTFGTVIALPHGDVNCKAGMTTVSGGSNFSDDASCGLTGAGDVQTGDPMLAALGDFSGPTPTRPPLMGSPVIDLAYCSASGGITVDQRGVTRPQGSACDTGSVEVRPSSLVVDKVVSGSPAPFPGPYTFAVACTDGTNTQVSVADANGGNTTAITGIKFGATCTVVESTVTGSTLPLVVSYDPVGVNAAGMPIDQDGQQFTVTVTNAYVLRQPSFTG